MIIIRLQLAVSNYVNVQVKRLKYFSRFWGYKRFVNHKTYRKTLFFSKQGWALKNNTNTSHISVFSHGENPTEFFCKVCLVPEKTTLKFFVFTILCWGSFIFMICLYITFQIRDLINTNTILTFKHGKPISMGPKTDK